MLRRMGLVVLAALLAALLAAWSPAWAQSDPPGRWLRAESEHFVVYSDRSENLLREYVTMLEDFDGILRLLHGRTEAATPRKLPVYLVSNTRQLRRAYPEAPENGRGVYFTSLDDIFAVAIREGAGGEYDTTKGDDVVLHEYTHHFMMQYFPAGYPGWMIEGLAEYYMTADLQAKKVTIGNFNAGRAYALVNERWLPMDVLLTKRPSDLDRDDVSAFYAQSWLLTHYLWSDKGRRAKLETYLDAVRAGKPAMESWTAVYGDDAKTLERNLRAYMRKSLMGMSVMRTPPTPQIAFTRLPAGADDLILEVQLIKRGVSEEQGKALLPRVRELAAKRPNEFYSRLVLARAECDFGDRAAGEKILKTLLDERPNDLEALQVMAYSRLAAARTADFEDTKAIYAEAVKYLGRAHKVDGDNYLTLYGYAEARSFDREPTENTLNVIYRAAEIAPQSPAIRLNAARLFMRAGRYSVARQMLAPIAANPHGGGQAKQASNILKDLEGKEDKPEPPTPAATEAKPPPSPPAPAKARAAKSGATKG
ncbi:peptidase MA family metallohydrolase [Caulobacter hibisci]|uniref:Peptidase MA-like domain-containing protein n=1 Tax=Caulobacter hibisci TaxID=2035993 RepID=A0ABS0T3X4_9CAUL|nr:hypothetical protein [Caulobacter hibisci]MBI1686529.1 hypothetical protein [Caulobacter hibisci]